MNNPYEVLGVSETATDEEVKAAYRNLAKKYHPDNYTDSPLADVAEQKMKEINEAYDMINQMRQKGKGTGSTGSSSYNANSSSSQFYNVRIYIQRGLLDQADQILENTAQSMRTAEWHYLKGMIAYRRGWSEQAFHISQLRAIWTPTTRNTEPLLTICRAREHTTTAVILKQILTQQAHPSAMFVQE